MFRNLSSHQHVCTMLSDVPSCYFCRLPCTCHLPQKTPRTWWSFHIFLSHISFSQAIKRPCMHIYGTYMYACFSYLIIGLLPSSLPFIINRHTSLLVQRPKALFLIYHHLAGLLIISIYIIYFMTVVVPVLQKVTMMKTTAIIAFALFIILDEIGRKQNIRIIMFRCRLRY